VILIEEIAKTPSEAVKLLWESHFFKHEKDLNSVKFKLGEEGNNFEDPQLSTALTRAPYLIRHGIRGNFKYIQRFRPPTKVAYEKIYSGGEAYEFYKDIKSLMKTAKNEVFIVDGYVNEELFDIYVEKISNRVKIRILTRPDTYKGHFYDVAKKFSLKPNAKFEIRETTQCHDRVIFIDSSAWVSGQSIKDAAIKKPTYLIKVRNVKKLRKIYHLMWISAIKVHLK